MSSSEPMLRRWFGRLTLLAIGLTVLIGVVLLNTVDGPGLDRLQRDIREAAPLLSLIRLTVIAGLFLAWPSLLRFCRQRSGPTWCSCPAGSARPATTSPPR